MGKAQTAKKPGPETVWAILKENAAQIKELKELHKETKREIKDYNKRFGEFHNCFGEVIEYMVAPNLLKKFREIGLDFTKANKTKIEDYKNDMFFEVDYMLENGEKAMLVEVKTTLTTEKVREHIKRLGKMRKYADLHGDKRAFLGAVAGWL